MNDNLELFSGSKFIKVLNKLNLTTVSQIAFILAIALSWYEIFLVNIGVSVLAQLNISTVLLFLALLFCDKSKIKSSKAITYLLLFIVTALISMLVALFFDIQLVILTQGLVLFMQFIVAFIVGSTYQKRHKLVNLSLALLIPIMLVGLYQGIWGQETSSLWVSTAENLVSRRAYGFFGSPNILGSLTMMSGIVSIFYYLKSKNKLYILIAVLSVIVLVLSYSRSAWIGFIAGLIIAMIVKNWRYILLSPVALLILVIPSVRQRFMTIFTQAYIQDAALDGRIWSVNNAISIFKGSPVFGTGPGSYGGQTAIQYVSPVYLDGFQNGYISLPYTDNQWLQILVQTGLIGSVLLLGFFISNLANNIKRYLKKHDYTYLMVVALTVAFFINGCFANIMEFGAVAIWAGLLLSQGEVYDKK